MLRKYNYITKKSKCGWGEILDNSLCGGMPAEKLGHDGIFLTSFCMVESFHRPGDIVHTSIDPIELPWAPYISAIDYFVILQLFA